MNSKNISLLSLVAAMALSTACTVEDDPGADTDTETNASTMTNTDPTNMTDPTASSTSTTNGTETDTVTDTDPTVTDTDPSDTDTDTDTDTDDIDPDLYDFREDEPDAYTRVDRKGFPAINTALIAPDNKDAYNASNPAADVDMGMTFAGDAVATLQFLHGSFDAGATGLNDDLVLANTLLGTDLVPCGATPGVDTSCLNQAVPLAFPDVVLLDTSEPTGFPNGRALEVPVVDIILAAVLINVSSDPGLLQAFATVGLSQSPNDVAFSDSFPYLGAAHE